jgi:AcrR family transcriptional regulator
VDQRIDLSELPPGVRTRRDRTKERLLDAAAGIFAARGFHGASVEDVAAEAGLTKGAVYSNFDSKEALFLALLDREVAQLHDVLAALLALPAEQRAAALDDRLADVHVLQRDWVLLELEFLLYAARNPAARDAFAARRREDHARLAAVLAAHLADLGVEGADDTAAAVAPLLSACADGISAAALVDDDAEPASRIALLTDLLLRTGTR